MNDQLDPRRPIIEVMARLGRETQLHLDERERHFQITDGVILGISMLLIVLAIFNVYNVRVLYTDLDKIVSNMENMLGSLGRVEQDMGLVADRVDDFDRHMARLGSITSHVASLSTYLPRMHGSMASLAANMSQIKQDMTQLTHAVHAITPNMLVMTRNMGVMRYNMHQLAKPMGSFNTILP